ncbi:MAG: recombinase family protein [Planctomycetia bacterium]|nr:recombinase family protein [Planctomycetia bacterium]
MTRPRSSIAPERTRRCAIYTRKSTEEGLDSDFNTLDAQRESGEAFVKSQQHEGWTCLPTHYDDGGYTGGNMDRPALQRLLADIQSGTVNVVAVYKVDRLSRSLLDFARMMEVFDRHNVAFVSVTQQFNTATSMGRLVLNVLLSFAQFEREMISERTRDKIAAARRKGKWSGGHPILGYDVVETKLVVNEVEAQRVRQIFDLYLDNLSLLATADELNRLGWTTKAWTTKKGKGTRRGGRLFTKGSVYHLLTNVAYAGKVKYKAETHAGEHTGIVGAEVFQRVQSSLHANGRSGGRGVRNKHGALLRGLLRCASCGCGMRHAYSSKGERQYRYYVCAKAQQRGWDACPSPSVPAGEIERFVVEQVRCIGKDPSLLAATLAQVRQQTEAATQGLTAEKAALERQRRDDDAELRRLVGEPDAEGRTGRMAEILDRQRAAEHRLAEISAELSAAGVGAVDDDAVAAALAEFDGVWSALVPREQARVLELLIERVEYDGQQANVSLTFRPTGIQALATELSQHEEQAA